MRIKLNLAQLKPSGNPTIYWLHVDLSYILLIKQLKEKVQKVLKEHRDIELCFDNIPFLDEDDIHAINENEEITIKVKEGNNFTDSNCFEVETCASDISIVPNGISSFNSLNCIPVPLNKIPSSVTPPKQKKRVRKRTHKKSKQVEPIELVKNNVLGSQSDTSNVSSKEPSKMHKRFKLDNENNEKEYSLLKSSDEECFHVSREVFCNDSLPLNSNITKNTVQSKQKGNALKFTKVPVFVRNKTCLDVNSTPNGSFLEKNDNMSATNSTNEDYMLVVDWKNMSPVKLSSITELQLHDLIQFKTLSLKQFGEPEMSSVITARLNHICKETSHLTIQILSGIEEFMALNSKFKIDDEETGTEFEVEYVDLFEIFKLV